MKSYLNNDAERLQHMNRNHAHLLSTTGNVREPMAACRRTDNSFFFAGRISQIEMVSATSRRVMCWSIAAVTQNLTNVMFVRVECVRFELDCAPIDGLAAAAWPTTHHLLALIFVIWSTVTLRTRS